jgi:hypothetical protein
MQEKLSLDKKQLLFEKGKKVYEAYSLLDMASNNAYYACRNDSSFLINEKKQSLKDYIISLILQFHLNAKSYQENFQMGESSYSIELTEVENNRWDIKLFANNNNHNHPPSDLKMINEYRQSDLFTFSQEYPLFISKNEAEKFSLGL